MKRLDCRGMTCPQPVLATKDLIEEHPREIIEVLVDNKASKENVKRFLSSQGWEVTVREVEEGSFLITGAPGTCELDLTPEEQERQGENQRILIFIPSYIVGSGSQELGEALMKNFISTLGEMGSDLWRIILVNSGVKLSTKESPVLDALRSLEEQGVDILVCGTCLEYYSILDQKAVGQTTNMLDIITSMQLASKVIRI